MIIINVVSSRKLTLCTSTCVSACGFQVYMSDAQVIASETASDWAGRNLGFAVHHMPTAARRSWQAYALSSL